MEGDRQYMAVENTGTGAGPSTYAGGQGGDGNWHMLEIYIDHATGTFKVRNDGVVRLSGAGLNFGAGVRPWAELNLTSNWSSNGPEWAHDANNHIYWDNVEIFSDATTGAPATGNMSDFTVQAGAAMPPVDPLAPILADIAALKAADVAMKTDIATMKIDIAALKADVASLKAKLASIKAAWAST